LQQTANSQQLTMQPYDDDYQFDSFPPEFNLGNCMKIIGDKQHDLIKVVRRNFYKQVQVAVDNCDKSVELVFPENLWGDFRIQVSKEIMERYGQIDIMVDRRHKNEFDVALNSASDPADIPPDVKSVRIVFTKK